MSYAINIKSISYETFEEEVVLINLRKGFYYSLEQVAKVVWHLIEQMQPSDTIIEEIERLYQGDPEEMRRSLLAFFHQLEEEEIILPTALKNSPPPAILDQPKQPFTPPVLNKHRDLQDLLLLDPIHEVNEAGWPAYQNAKV